MPAPTVSVIMPAYNSRRYVGLTIDSILAQTFRDFEYIVVDDGSTDGTDAVIRKYLADSRVRMYRRPNTGIVGACNDAVGMASGEFLARIDSDDVAKPEKLEKQVAFLRARPDHVACGTQVETIDPYGAVLHPMQHKLTHEEIDAQLMRGVGFAMVNPAVMMRRDALLKVGGYRKKYETAEDLDLFLRLAEVGKLANLPDYLLQYRQHYKSINHTKHDAQRQMKRGMMEEAYARRGVAMPENLVFNRTSPPPQYEQTCRWGWWALKHGNRYAARRHAVDAMRLAPLRLDSWRLLFSATRGH